MHPYWKKKSCAFYLFLHHKTLQLWSVHGGCYAQATACNCFCPRSIPRYRLSVMELEKVIHGLQVVLQFLNSCSVFCLDEVGVWHYLPASPPHLIREHLAFIQKMISSFQGNCPGMVYTKLHWSKLYYCNYVKISGIYL